MQDSLATVTFSEERGAPTLMRFERVSYAVNATSILTDISLDLCSGPPTVLLGPNGSGKTTLLKVAMELILPTSGRIAQPQRQGARGLRKAIVFQDPVMLRRTAASNVRYALEAAHRQSSATAVERLLARVGMAALANRPARKLSSGEQQRLALARALAREPEILFLDEPTSNLDPNATKGVEDIIAHIAAEGVKVVIATHDLGQARRVANDVVFLANGRLLEQAPATDFFHGSASEVARRFLAGELVL
jgi:tungstate transport system ATP-binding protein